VEVFSQYPEFDAPDIAILKRRNNPARWLSIRGSAACDLIAGLVKHLWWEWLISRNRVE
jgi:hypothetical protein